MHAIATATKSRWIRRHAPSLRSSSTVGRVFTLWRDPYKRVLLSIPLFSVQPVSWAASPARAAWLE